MIEHAVNPTKTVCVCVLSVMNLPPIRVQSIAGVKKWYVSAKPHVALWYTRVKHLFFSKSWRLLTLCHVICSKTLIYLLIQKNLDNKSVEGLPISLKSVLTNNQKTILNLHRTTLRRDTYCMTHITWMTCMDKLQAFTGSYSCCSFTYMDYCFHKHRSFSGYTD